MHVPVLFLLLLCLILFIILGVNLCTTTFHGIHFCRLFCTEAYKVKNKGLKVHPYRNKVKVFVLKIVGKITALFISALHSTKAHILITLQLKCVRHKRTYFRVCGYCKEIRFIKHCLWIQVILHFQWFRQPYININNYAWLKFYFYSIRKVNSNQYSKTNVMYFSFNLLRNKGLYMFRGLLVHVQEALQKQHLEHSKPGSSQLT
jgi:hypothetical protein